jgi:phage-related protein
MKFAAVALDNGFTFGDIPADEYGAFLTNYQIPPTPSTVDNELIISGHIGPYDAGTDLLRLDISLQIGYWVPNSGRAAINNAIRRHMAWFDPRLDYRQLIFDEDPDYFLMAKLTSSTGSSQVTVQSLGPNGEMAAIVDIAMKCKDPHWYSVGQELITVPAGPISNPGTAPTPVTVVLTATGASADGDHKGVVVGGVEVGYAGAMTAGQTVTIDTDQWTVVAPDGSNGIGGWYGEMPMLPGGESTVDVVGPCSAEITYMPRWLA